MQFAADAQLAAALKEGQKRNFGNTLMIDWARDDGYADPFSNLSANIDEWDLDRSLNGVVPDSLQTTEGYSTAKLTIKLTGNAPDGTPLWKVFSPFSGLTYGSGAALNIPMVLQCVVLSPLGVWNVDQFTGWIDSAIPDLASGEVTMTCFDGGGQLETGITTNRWGADQRRREVFITGDFEGASMDENSESCTIEAGWLIDSALRRTGFFQGPVWHPNAIHTRTLRGSALPEIGAWNQIPDTDFDYIGEGMPSSTPHRGPAMETPGEVWSIAAGKYGPAFKGRYRMPLWRGTTARNIFRIGSGTKSNEFFVPTTYGGNNSNILGWSAWVFVDSTLSADPWSTDTFFLSSVAGASLLPARATVTVKHKTNSIVFTVTNDGSSSIVWSWSNALGGDGWHFVSLTIQFTSTQVRGSMWLDGANVINQSNGSHTGAAAVSSYTWIEGTTNAIYFDLQAPMQFTQWIMNMNTPIASYVQPLSTPPLPRRQAKVDLTGQRLLWFPNIEQTPAGDVIQAVTGADLGAFYFTEQGVATYDNRATIKARQLAANSVFDITIDTASNLTAVSSYLSVANRIGWTARPRVAQPYLPAYSASKPDQFIIQPGGTPRFNATLSDVQAHRCGQISARNFAQGYDPGLSPPTLLWQEYMQHYQPAYWREGTTPYEPGSQPSNGPPPILANTAAFALPGWANGDLDDRHMRLAFINNNTSPAKVAQFSVNDSVPFLIVGGTVLVDRPTVTESVSDATSIARFRERVFNLAADDWHQDILWLRSVGASLLADTKNPTVQFQDIEVVGDPRRQLQDVCRIVHRDAAGGQPGMTGATQAYGSVVGIKRKFTKSGDAAKLVDTLTIRTFPT